MIKQETTELNFLKSVFILERFAVAFSEKTEINKTHLQLRSKLRWDLFNKYLVMLQAKNFVKCRKEGRIELYFLTEDGMKFFRSLTSFLDYLK